MAQDEQDDLIGGQLLKVRCASIAAPSPQPTAPRLARRKPAASWAAGSYASCRSMQPASCTSRCAAAGPRGPRAHHFGMAPQSPDAPSASARPKKVIPLTSIVRCAPDSKGATVRSARARGRGSTTAWRARISGRARCVPQSKRFPFVVMSRSGDELHLAAGTRDARDQWISTLQVRARAAAPSRALERSPPAPRPPRPAHRASAFASPARRALASPQERIEQARQAETRRQGRVRRAAQGRIAAWRASSPSAPPMP